MKKLSILFLALVLTLSLGIIAFAEDYTVPTVAEFAGADVEYVDVNANYTVTLSNDLQKLFLNERSYSRADVSALEIDYEGWTYEVDLTASQLETVKHAYADSYSSDRVIQVVFYMKDGTEMTVYFLRDDLRAGYDRLMAGEADQWILDFEYPDGNTVTVGKAQLMGQDTVVTAEDCKSSMNYPVYSRTEDGTMLMNSGVLLNKDGSYYYVPYPEDMVGEKAYYMLYDYLMEHKQAPAVKLTDEALLQQLDAAQQAYYDDDLGFLYDDTLTEKISELFLVLVFAIVPGIVAVLFLILALRAKTRSYKKLFWLTCALSAAELAVFITIANMLH